MEVIAAPYGWCSDLDVTEARAMRAFKVVAAQDPRFATACEQVSGWKITVHDTPAILYPEGFGVFVRGYSKCFDTPGVPVHETNVGSPSSGNGALAHEMAHMVQNCQPLPPEGRDPHHSNWETSIYPALVAEGLPW